MANNIRTPTERLLLIVKGMIMGTANKVPGVSGGIVAFVGGFYEEFIHSLQQFNAQALKLFLRCRFKRFYTHINGSFLSLLILGMLISYFSISKLLDYFIIHYELYVWATFFGLIIGSIHYIVKDFDDWNKKNIAFISLGILIGISISFLEPANENDNLWFVFFCGIIGVSGMTLPGLSGSFLLILLGNYVLLLVDAVNALYNLLKALVQFDFSFVTHTNNTRLLQVLLVFTLGSLVGLITLSHFLGLVLRHYKNQTYACTIGFITGSLGVVWPWKHKIFKTTADGTPLLDMAGNSILDNYKRYLPNMMHTETYIAIFFIFSGIVILWTLGWYENKQKSKEII